MLLIVAFAVIASRQPAALLSLLSEAREQTGGPLLQLEPSGSLSGAFEDLSLGMIYKPRFLLPAPETDRSFLQLHRAAAEGIYRASSGTWLGLHQELLYGREDFSWQTQLAEDPTPNFSRTPLARAVLIMQSLSSASLRQRLDSHLEINASGGWQVSGGANADARTLIPLARSATGSISGAWTTSRDRLSLAVNGAHEIVANLTGNVVGAVADWQHRFNLGPTLRTSLGVSRAAGSLQRDVFPSGALSFGIEPVPDRRRLGGSLSLSAQPLVDPQTGTLIERVVAAAAGSVLVTRALTFSAAAAAAKITGGTTASTTDWQAAANATWSFGSHLAVSVGARGVSQPERQWAAFIAVSSWYRNPL